MSDRKLLSSNSESSSPYSDEVKHGDAALEHSPPESTPHTKKKRVSGPMLHFNSRALYVAVLFADFPAPKFSYLIHIHSSARFSSVALAWNFWRSHGLSKLLL